MALAVTVLVLVEAILAVEVFIMRWVEAAGGGGAGGQDSCIIGHVAFLSINKFLLCCNSPSSNGIHPSVLHSAAAAAFAVLCVETDSCEVELKTCNANA